VADLVAALLEEALAKEADVPSLLRKCIALGSAANSAALRSWATLELKGYEPDHTLPGYRLVGAPLLLDATVYGGRVSNQMVPHGLLPEDMRTKLQTVPFTHSIAGVIQMLASARERGEDFVRLGPSNGDIVARLLTSKLNEEQMVGMSGGQHVDRVYWSVGTSAIAEIVDNVRTVLVELAVEMRAGTPPGSTPNPEVADQAVAVAVHGSDNHVTVIHAGGGAAVSTGGDASAGAPPPESAARKVTWWMSQSPP
jgi:hypothetical protein